MTQPDLLDPPRRPLHRGFLVTALVTFGLAVVWFATVRWLSQTGVVAQAVIFLGLPIGAAALGAFRHPDRRLQGLVLIQTAMLAVTLLDQVALQRGWLGVRQLCHPGFLVYLLAQAVGFATYQIKRGKPSSVLPSALFLLLCAFWWWNGSLAVVDAEGRYFLLGTSTPWEIVVGYVAAVTGPLLVESARLPCMTQVIVQAGSLAVCLASPNFLYLRIATACHAFAMDLTLGYARSDSAWGRRLSPL